MSHFELFRCDGRMFVHYDEHLGNSRARIAGRAAACVPAKLSAPCTSFLEISADTFPTLVLGQIRDAEWTTVQELGKPERHYCPIHKAVAV